MRRAEAGAAHIEEYGFLLGLLPDRAAIAEAMMRAEALGVLPHQVLIAGGRISASAYSEALAHHLGVATASFDGIADLEIAPDEWIASPLVAWRRRTPGRVEAVLDSEAFRPHEIARILRDCAAAGGTGLLAPAALLRSAAQRQHGAEVAARSVHALRRKAPHLSAAMLMSRGQAGAMLGIAGLLAIPLVLSPEATAGLGLSLLSLPFAAIVALRTLALLLAVAPAAPVPVPARRRSDAELPIYTVLVPLFREERVLSDLVRALRRLDYPREKLDIKLIFEEIDAETRAAAAALRLEAPFELLVVPDIPPRTKPKALNFALAFARGSFVTVFDAEDIPEPGQLREALAAFDAGGPKLACVQARLAIDNAGDGFLAAQFAIEYAALFDALLPALVRLGVPIPLGGTSNHFRNDLLRRAGAWDAWNVTEDADLGIRLARLGLESGVIASTTSEEAPFRPGAWLRQRTRWLKGWMQTALVHTRDPVGLVLGAGPWGSLGIAVLMGGLIASALVHPVLTAILVVGAVEGAPFGSGDSLVGVALWWLSLGNLALGYGAAIAVAAVALVRRRRLRLLPQVLLLPVYWQLISVAAYRALWQLLREPHLWEKTEHGLGRRVR